MAKALYPVAHTRFWIIFRYDAFESLITPTTARGSSEARMTPADSIATSVPAPIAMPTSALARAGASLTPSPTTMATRWPRFCNSATFESLSSGRTSAKYSSIPSSLATAAATCSASPVVMARRSGYFLEHRVEHVPGRRIAYLIDEEDFGLDRVLLRPGFSLELESRIDKTQVIFSFFHDTKG